MLCGHVPTLKSILQLGNTDYETVIQGYPSLCHALGISPARSLSFASRSLTLALATPATQNLRGDLQLVAVLCIMSGVMGVLVGPTLLKWMRIPEDDYVTRGVTLGGNSSAIATALLLVSDPRAAALSSLSMSLFGTVMVGLTSVPIVVRVVVRVGGLGGRMRVCASSSLNLKSCRTYDEYRTAPLRMPLIVSLMR